MKWNRYTDQAIRALKYLTLSRAPAPSAELAEYLDISQQTMIQNASPLVSAGLIGVIPGAKGGYFLAKSSNLITLYDIIELLEDHPLFPESERKSEIIASVEWVYGFLERSVDEIFKSITIMHVAENNPDTIRKRFKRAMNNLIAALAEDSFDMGVGRITHNNV